MLTLPLMNGLIILGSVSLLLGVGQKVIWLSTLHRPGIPLALAPLDFVAASGIFLLLALCLAARAWAKRVVPRPRMSRRNPARLEARERHSGTEVPTSQDAISDAAHLRRGDWHDERF